MIRYGTALPGQSPAHQEVVGALDQECAIWGFAGGDGRSRFIQHCLRYGLLSLVDGAVLELSESAEPEFRSDAVDDTLLAGVSDDAMIAEELPTAHRLGSGRVRWRRLSSDAVSQQERLQVTVLNAVMSPGCFHSPQPALLDKCSITATSRHSSQPPAPPRPSNQLLWILCNRSDLSMCDGVVPAVAVPASVVAGARLHQGCDLRAGSPRQSAFESSGLVLRNPILLLSNLAISGIACSGTSPASTPAATDFSRASCSG